MFIVVGVWLPWLQVQVSQLTDKREKLSHELQDLLSQVSHPHTITISLTHILTLIFSLHICPLGVRLRGENT